jgi:dTDP-4-amino-4,6-dideoxygalactose transaminase
MALAQPLAELMTALPRFHSTAPRFVGAKLDYIAQAMACGQIAGDQTFSRKCQALLEQVLSVPKVFVTTSCTHAFEMAALLLDTRPGDEVIVHG